MKKVSFILIASLMTIQVFAQSDKYVKKMNELVSQVDSVRDATTLEALVNTFERVGDAEKTQWLPYYYAALCQTNAAYFKGTNGQIGADVADPAADKADAMITKALALTKENSEIWCVKKMIATLRMSADPMNRWMQYGPIAAEALAKAKEMDANNPRVYLLEGQDKFYTPEQFGGSKTEEKKMFEKALELYSTFKPVSDLHPVWGKGSTAYFLSQTK
jgi:hypothetical protein